MMALIILFLGQMYKHKNNIEMKKKYYNATTHEWYTEGQTMTRTVNGVLFSGVPSVNQLTAWGFVEWVEPKPTPAELLERAKQQKISELMAYDNSDAVNEFTVVYDGKTFTSWIEPEKRSNYRGSLDSAELLGETNIAVPLGGEIIPLTIADAKVKLAQVQLYADRCTIVTESHKAAINALQTVADVEAYDFTTGYPTKLVFNLEDLT